MEINLVSVLGSKVQRSKVQGSEVQGSKVKKMKPLLAFVAFLAE